MDHVTLNKWSILFKNIKKPNYSKHLFTSITVTGNCMVLVNVQHAVRIWAPNRNVSSFTAHPGVRVPAGDEIDSDSTEQQIECISGCDCISDLKFTIPPSPSIHVQSCSKTKIFLRFVLSYSVMSHYYSEPSKMSLAEGII